MTTDLHAQLDAIGHATKRASRALARTSGAQRNDALAKMADALIAHAPAILAANAHDVSAAHEAGMDASFVDRLTLNTARIAQMAAAVREIIALPDPIGGTDEIWMRPNGLQVGRRRIPLGTIGFIYESRPNVTSDAAALCLKSGNGVILKGGKESLRSNTAIMAALRAGLDQSALPEAARAAVALVPSPEREATKILLGMSQHLDLVIPRGGKNLIAFVSEHARVPVIKHDEGVCHIVLDGSADPEHVHAILLNAKTQRTSVCNAAECLLVLESAVDNLLPDALRALASAGVVMHLCPRSMEVARAAGIDAKYRVAAQETDWGREFLALAIAVRIVPDLDAAIAHIDRYGSNHTESLLTRDYGMSQRFLREVDSSCVIINASTRFADGGQLGLGAEIGISTTKMHAYGPMGLRELTTTKFIVLGDGQTRDA
jgi:glutamate-5-semialdehyde dehydrogenase